MRNKIVSVRGIPWLKIGGSYYLSQIELRDKGLSIKWLVYYELPWGCETIRGVRNEQVRKKILLNLTKMNSDYV